MRAPTPTVTLLLFLATSLHALHSLSPELSLDVIRGLEYHNARQHAQLWGLAGGDSLRLELNSQWRKGFRSHNRDSRRLHQQLQLEWLHPAEKFNWLVEGQQSIFVEEFQGLRSRRRSLKGEVAAGVGIPVLFGHLDALAGTAADFRAGIRDAGPLGRLKYRGRNKSAAADWRFQGTVMAANLSDRQSRDANFSGELKTPLVEGTTDKMRVSYAGQWQDLYLNENEGLLEAHMESQLRFENELGSDLGAWGRARLFLEAWSARVNRDPWKRDSLSIARTSRTTTARSSHYRDLGIQSRIISNYDLGAWHSEAEFSLMRSRQDSRYQTIGAIGENNLSRIQMNRLALRVWGEVGRDSLYVHPRLEMRRRHTQVDRDGVARDEQDLDRLSLLVETGVRHRLQEWADMGLQLTLSRQGEHHLKASRSQGNHELRRLQFGVTHALRPWPVLHVNGKARTSVTLRLYEYESLDLPRSTIQRRWQAEETISVRGDGFVSRRVHLLSREELRFRLRWLLEDGGRYARQDQLELLSDSAEELEMQLAWRFYFRGGWIAPGLRWLNHRDFLWESSADFRSRKLNRELFRRGPELEGHLTRKAVNVRAQIYYERVDVGGRKSWNLWGELGLEWFPGRHHKGRQ